MLLNLVYMGWGKVAVVRVEEFDFGSGMGDLFEKLGYFTFFVMKWVD